MARYRMALPHHAGEQRGTYCVQARPAAAAWLNPLRKRENYQPQTIRSTDIAFRRIATARLPRPRVSAPLHRETLSLDAAKTANDDCHFAIPIGWPTQAAQRLNHLRGSGLRTQVYEQRRPEPATDRSAFLSGERRRSANACARRHSVQDTQR